MSELNPDIAAKIAALRSKMGLAAAASSGAPAAAAPTEAPTAAPAAGGGAAVGGDMAAKVAALKAKMGGAPAPAAAAPAAAAATTTAAPAAAAPAAGGEDMQARIAALKAKMEAGKTAAKAPAAKAAAKPAPKPAAKKGGKDNIFPVQPVNRRTFGDERLYGPLTVNRWFTVGALVLLVSVILMWRRDHVRDWKYWQSTFHEREIERLRIEAIAADEGIDAAELDGVKSRITALQQRMEGNQAQHDDLLGAQNEADGLYYAANMDFQIAKALYEEARYNFEEIPLYHGDDAERIASAADDLEQMRLDMEAKKLVADEAKRELDRKKAALNEFLTEQTTLDRELSGLREARDRLAGSLAKLGVEIIDEDSGDLLEDVADLEGTRKLSPDLFNKFVRNAPVADMLSPTLKVNKYVLDKLKDNYNFMYVGKVDMCTTCHIAIDKPEYTNWDLDNSKGEKGERVLNAHPRLDLFVSDSSPHPAGEFGCTVCHMGRGQAIEFERTFHTPVADAYETKEEKQARWVRDLGYDPDRHYWDWPMTPADKSYSSCFQCHQETDRIPGVPEYNESRALVEELGCYGCHKIQGMEHLRKPGPDLTNVAAKTDRTWANKWSLSPISFRPSTRMPHFWHQSNSGANESELSMDADREWRNQSDNFVPNWRARNQVEARAVVSYVFDKSEKALAGGSYDMISAPDSAGDPVRGQELFESRGCLGCHSMLDEGQDVNWHGPELSATGSKVNEQWLFNWLLDPKRYFDTTVMPDLRLTEEEAWDITAYLMEKRNVEWEEDPDLIPDAAIVDGIAKEYLSSIAGDVWADEQIAAMKADGGDAAVELYVGEKLFQRYGCSGCHLVPGHYEDVGIGTELTYESLKEVTKFDFGHEASHELPEDERLHHNRREWYRHKMRDPRVFDRMPIIVDHEVQYYDMKVKTPGEKLKMPNFYLDDTETELIVQFLLGLREDGIDETMKRKLTADEALVEEGSRLITKYNCIGCHRMGQLPQYYPIPHGEDFDENLELLEEALDEAMDQPLWMAESLEIDGKTIFHEGDWVSDEFYDEEYEEDYDIYEFFEDDESRPFPDSLLVYGYGEGGISEYIDARALAPPVLRGQGARTDPDWLFRFLIEPFTVRNHVEVRMPTFGLSEDESLALVRWFAHKDGEPWPFEVEEEFVSNPDLLTEAADLFEFHGCGKCHPAGDIMPTVEKTQWGPDLALTAERLKTSWLRAWLEDPQLIQPGTQMPNNFGEYSDGEYSANFEDWHDRITKLVFYMKHLDEVEQNKALSQN